VCSNIADEELHALNIYSNQFFGKRSLNNYFNVCKISHSVGFLRECFELSLRTQALTCKQAFVKPKMVAGVVFFADSAHSYNLLMFFVHANNSLPSSIFLHIDCSCLSAGKLHSLHSFRLYLKVTAVVLSFTCAGNSSVVVNSTLRIFHVVLSN
jgi:hypothetical protein